MAIALQCRFPWLAAGALVLAATSAQAAVIRCPDGTIRDTPCPVITAPAPEPPRPPCDLTPEQLRRALREEEQFLRRYGDEASHRRAQRADSAQIAARLRPADARLIELRKEYDRIVIELAFYEKRPVSPELLARVGVNVGQFAALTQIYGNLEHEIATTDGRYRCERATFGKLWAGAPRGSSACDRPPCAPS